MIAIDGARFARCRRPGGERFELGQYEELTSGPVMGPGVHQLRFSGW